jgi:hypothetical protein
MATRAVDYRAISTAAEYVSVKCLVSINRSEAWNCTRGQMEGGRYYLFNPLKPNGNYMYRPL